MTKGIESDGVTAAIGTQARLAIGLVLRRVSIEKNYR
jgi:hypothetical protein